MIPLRLYAYLAIALAIAGGLLYHRHVVKDRDRLEIALSAADSKLAIERKNRATEQADRRRSDEAVISLQAKIARINSEPKPVSVYCRPANLPATAGEGHAATGPDGAAVGQGVAGPVRDIGSALGAVRAEHKINAAIHDGLTEWERGRGH